MIQKLFRLAAILVFAFICFSTLSPISLRPGTGAVGPERFAAFGLLGLLAGLSFPERLFRVALFTVGAAMVLEALQLVVPTRHGQVADAAMKSLGGIAGVSLVALWECYFRDCRAR